MRLELITAHRTELLHRLDLCGDMLESVFVASENYLRSDIGSDSIRVLDLAFAPSRADDYRCLMDMLYGELTPWGRREVLNYYRGTIPRLKYLYSSKEISVIDQYILRVVTHLGSMYEEFVNKGWEPGVRNRTFMQTVRGSMSSFISLCQ